MISLPAFAEIGLGSARLVLSGVFLVAALAKLFDRTGVQQTLSDFGIPTKFTSFGATALPVVEIMVAVMLLPVGTARWAALASLGLLILFSVGIARLLLRGETPACRCFGRLSSASIGWSTFLRNVLLMAAAASFLFFGWNNPGPDFLAMLPLPSTHMEWIVSSATAVALLLGSVCTRLLFELIRQQGRVLVRLDAIETYLLPQRISQVGHGRANVTPRTNVAAPSSLRPGVDAPRFWAKSARGNRVGLETLLKSDRNIFLIFHHPHCGPCIALTPEVMHWQGTYGASLIVAVISSDHVDDSGYDQLDPDLALVHDGTDVSALYGVYGTPSAVIIRRDGMIGSEVVGGADAIRQLLSRALHDIESDLPVPISA